MRSLKGKCYRTPGPKGVSMKIRAEQANRVWVCPTLPQVDHREASSRTAQVQSWDTPLLHLEMSKAKQTDKNIRTHHPILFFTQLRFGLSLAAVSRLARVYITVYLANIGKCQVTHPISQIPLEGRHTHVLPNRKDYEELSSFCSLGTWNFSLAYFGRKFCSTNTSCLWLSRTELSMGGRGSMNWVLDTLNSFPATGDKRQHVLLGESFLHAYFMHEKIRTHMTWPASKTGQESKKSQKKEDYCWVAAPAQREEEHGHTELLGEEGS